MLKQKYFLADIFILSAEKQPIKLSWRKIVCLPIKGDVGTRVPASYHFGYLILDFYLFIVWTRVIEYTKNDRLLRIFWCMLVFSIVYRCVIPQITGNAILAYTMPWGMFDAFSVGGILAIRTKEKKPLLKTGHISAIVAVLLFIICVVSMMRANNVGG